MYCDNFLRPEFSWPASSLLHRVNRLGHRARKRSASAAEGLVSQPPDYVEARALGDRERPPTE
jgi:hypothetical protein